MRREISTKVVGMKTANSYEEWVESGKLNQATVIADSIGFARETEAAIKDGTLKALDLKLNAKIHMLASMARESSI